MCVWNGRWEYLRKDRRSITQNEVAPVSKASVACVDIRTNIGKVAGGATLNSAQDSVKKRAESG